MVTGDSANDLLGIALDPNVHIQGSKVGSCDIRPGRRPRGPALTELVHEYQQRAGLTPETSNTRVTDPEREIRGDHAKGQSSDQDSNHTEDSPSQGEED